ncbi:hypothetical protein B0T19DRAFT_419163 [Cercophora scortea]|uniref:Uncharacterized protein n=1 Tax=Cercophora scortea TaxID=314031 RepID=A0AAE0IYR7_9PEZI|nr:hypothetical protein B0T19DRAFT_419163 [Cercophora scortea]
MYTTQLTTIYASRAMDVRFRDNGNRAPRDAADEEFPGFAGPVPYSVVMKNAQQLGIDFETLPKPPPWAFLFGYSDKWCKSSIMIRVMNFSAMLGRPLEKAETDAVVQYSAQRNRIVSYEPVVWLPTTIFLHNRGYKTFRFPFVTPDPATFNPNVFPSQQMPLWSGQAAHKGWHALRLGAYGFLCHIMISSAFRMCADIRVVKQIERDPTLAALSERILEIGKARVQGLPPPPPPKHHPAVHQGTQSTEPSDDTSSGFYRPDSDAASSFGAQDEQATPASPAAARSTQQPQQQHRRPWRPQGAAPPPPPPPPPAPSAASEDDDFLFDDASPVAPSAQRPAPAPTPYTSGSAWERLRQRGRTGGDSGAQDEQTGAQKSSWAERRRQGSSQPADAYSYSQADQDKAYAKEQAQREFDAMLERERRGQSNDS